MAQPVIDPTRVVHETVDGEVIIIQLEKANYYSLSGCGREIWEMVCAGFSRDEIVKRMEAAYHAEPGEIPEDVSRLIASLKEEGIVEMGEGGSNGSIPRDAPRLAGGTFLPTKLEKYTDMQDFLLVDPIHDVTEQGWPVVRPAG